MRHLELGQEQAHHLLYLERGDKINSCIERFCKDNDIVHASFRGIGAIHKIDVACFEPITKKYVHTSYADTHELISLIGNLGYVKNNNDQDRYFAHTHIAFSNEKKEVYGGHLFEAEVRVVVEIYLTVYNAELIRTYNEEIGLNTMAIPVCNLSPLDA